MIQSGDIGNGGVKERRRARRFQQFFVAFLDHPQGIQTKRVGNLSETGLFLHTDYFIPPESDIRLRVILDHDTEPDEITVNGKVVHFLNSPSAGRSDFESGVGVQLDGFPTPADEEKFKLLIDNLENQQAAAVF